MSTLRTTDPSLRSRWLGRWLRELREDRGFTLRHVAELAGLRLAEIKSAELGRHLLEVGQVEALLNLYGVCDQYERYRLVNWARSARHLRRWEGRADAPPLTPTMLDFLWVESHAQQIWCYSTTLIPDLLQLPEYAKAVAGQSSGTASSSADGSWWSWACMERQRVLVEPPQATLRVVLAEAALYRSPGGSSGPPRRQLGHLARCIRLPHITLRVLPTAAPYLPGMDSSFTVFEPVPPRSRVAVVHAVTGPLIHEEQAGLYADAFEQLSRAALTPEKSTELIKEAAERSTNRKE